MYCLRRGPLHRRSNSAGFAGTPKCCPDRQARPADLYDIDWPRAVLDSAAKGHGQEGARAFAAGPAHLRRGLVCDVCPARRTATQAPSAKPAHGLGRTVGSRPLLRRLFLGVATSGRRLVVGGGGSLTGTDHHGAPVRLEISEAALGRSGGHLTIGRDGTQSNITIADHSVSRRHAVLWLGDGGLLIEDANSRNGMLVDGRDVPPLLGAVPVGSSTRLTLGGVELVVSVLPAAS